MPSSEEFEKNVIKDDWTKSYVIKDDWTKSSALFSKNSEASMPANKFKHLDLNVCLAPRNSKKMCVCWNWNWNLLRVLFTRR